MQIECVINAHSVPSADATYIYIYILFLFLFNIKAVCG